RAERGGGRALTGICLGFFLVLSDATAVNVATGVVPQFANTNRRPLMSESFSLPAKPEDMVAALVERFNSGKVSELMPLYEPEVVLVKPDGRTVTGLADMAADLEDLVGFGLPLKANNRHEF